MFDAPPINTETVRISRENVQLACIVCSLGLGILVIIDYLLIFFKSDHRSSNSLFLAFFIGFFHYSVGSVAWLKSTYQLHGISEFFFDVYTSPSCVSYLHSQWCGPKNIQEISGKYAPFTAILLWNIKESVLSGQQGQQRQLCITCDSTIRLQRYFLMFMMFVILIVRPTFWIVNFYCTLLPQDLIPCMTLCMVYPHLLSYFVYKSLYQEDYLHHRCKQRLYDCHEPKKEERTLVM